VSPRKADEIVGLHIRRAGGDGHARATKHSSIERGGPSVVPEHQMKRAADYLHGSLRVLSRLLASLVALVLIAMMLLTVIDVIGRYLFNRPLPGASEIIEFMVAIVVFGALPLVSAERDHIVIDMLDPFLGRRLKALQKIFVHLASAATLSLIGWRLWLQAQMLAEYGDITQFHRIPLAPLGFAMSVMAWIAATLVAGMFVAALRGEPDVSDRYGSLPRVDG
jgi:TRAP-type transport system small permease protein